MVTLLVDANNLAVRSVMAHNAHMNVGDVDTGPLVLFVNTLSRYVRMERPDCGLICWDSGKSAYRTRLYPNYKANRSQKVSDLAQQPIALIQIFLRLAGVPQLQLPGYEGDDLVYASWRACRARERIKILSSDKDLAQMIDDHTDQIRLVPNGQPPDVWTRTRFIKEKGYKPEYQAWVLALAGDASDGIPGLNKVGPKTALKMLRQHDWDMSALVESLPEHDQQKVLTNVALIDLEYVPLELSAPPEIEFVTPESEGWDKLAQFLDKWQLNQIKDRLENNRLWSN